MPRSRVFMHDSLVDHRIDDRYSRLKGSGGVGFDARSGSGSHFFDGRAHFRTQGHVVGAALNRLFGALNCRLNIGQGTQTPARLAQPRSLP